MKQNEHIEILRALAILYVLLLHLSVLPYARELKALSTFYAWFDLSVGVDLFFVVSGFVITRSLSDYRVGAGVPRFRSVLAFWVRRVYRLLPTAWLWLFVALLINVFSRYMSGNLDALWADFSATAAALLNALNFYRPYCLQNQELAWCTTDFMISHYWSLSLEEQFYIFFPLLLFYIRRPTLIALFVLCIALQFPIKRPMFTWLYFVKFDALSWGVLLGFASNTAVFQRLKTFASSRPLCFQLFLALSAVAMPMIGARVQGVWDAHTFGVATVAIVGALVVFLAALEPGTVGHEKYHRFMVYLGSRSYAIYVIHLIVIVTLARIIEHFFPVESASSGFFAVLFLSQAALAVAVTLVLSELNYRYIESRWRNRGRQISQRILE